MMISQRLFVFGCLFNLFVSLFSNGFRSVSYDLSTCANLFYLSRVLTTSELPRRAAGFIHAPRFGFQWVSINEQLGVLIGYYG